MSLTINKYLTDPLMGGGFIRWADVGTPGTVRANKILKTNNDKNMFGFNNLSASGIINAGSFNDGFMTITGGSMTDIINITATGTITTDILKTDDIYESTLGNGVNIDGINIKDGIIYTDDILEKTIDHGVEIEGITVKDSNLLNATNIMALKATGFGTWSGSGDYWSRTGTSFTLLRGGAGYIRSNPITFTGPQTTTLTTNLVNIVYIDSSGLIQTSNTRTDELYEDNIILFEVLLDSNNIIFVKKENHPCCFSVSVSEYIHHTIGTIWQNSSTITVGTLPDEIEFIGHDNIVDHGIQSTVSDIDGIVVNFFYLNASGYWTQYGGATSSFPMVYNSGGTITTLSSTAKYGVFRLYGVLDNLNSDAVQWFCVINNTQYANALQAQNAISDGLIQSATNELSNLEPAQYGYITVNDGIISRIRIEKASLSAKYIGGTVAASHISLSDKDAGTYGTGGHNNMCMRHESTSDPTINDDITNYLPECIWVNTSTDDIFINVDNTDGAAVWKHIPYNGGVSDFTTITVDTINEHTSTHGVIIDGLKIKDGAIVESAASTGMKLAVYGTSLGIGIQSNLMEFITDVSTNDYRWGYGTSGALTQTMYLDSGLKRLYVDNVYNTNTVSSGYVNTPLIYTQLIRESVADAGIDIDNLIIKDGAIIQSSSGLGMKLAAWGTTYGIGVQGGMMEFITNAESDNYRWGSGTTGSLTEKMYLFGATKTLYTGNMILGNTTDTENHQLTIQSTDDAILYINGDCLNNDETKTAKIFMAQDGRAIATQIGFNLDGGGGNHTFIDTSGTGSAGDLVFRVNGRYSNPAYGVIPAYTTEPTEICRIKSTGFTVDTINELTASNGVNIDGLNIKDGKIDNVLEIITDANGSGVYIDSDIVLMNILNAGSWATGSIVGDTVLRNQNIGKSILLSDGSGVSFLKVNSGGIYTNTITELTASNGVTIEGISLKDNTINTGGGVGYKLNIGGTTPGYGLGLQSSLLEFITNSVNSDYRWGYGTSGALTQTMFLDSGTKTLTVDTILSNLTGSHPVNTTGLGLKVAAYGTSYGLGIQAGTLEFITNGNFNWGSGTSGSLTQGMYLNNSTRTLSIDNITELTAAHGVIIDGITLKDNILISSGVNIGSTTLRENSFELGSQSSASATFIDFHSDGATTDYNARIIRNSGTDGTFDITNIGTGDINIYSAGEVDIEGVKFNSSKIATNLSAIAIGSGTLAYNSDISIGYQAGAATTGSYNINMGYQTGHAMVSGAAHNIDMGYQAGLGITTGDYNLCLLRAAGSSITTGTHDICIGYATQCGASDSYAISMGYSAASTTKSISIGYISKSDAYDISFGVNAGSSNTLGNNITMGENAGNGTPGNDNILIGTNSGTALANTGADANYNTFVGFETGKATTTGKKSTFLGASAGETCTTGSNNVCIGNKSDCSSDADYCIAIGDNAVGISYDIAIGTLVGSKTTRSYNVFVGSDIGTSMVNTGGAGTSNFNCCVGYQTGKALTRGAYNCFYGRDAGLATTTGSSNCFYGYNAGYTNESGINNTFIGTGAYGASTAYNQTCIGSGATTGYSNRIQLGNSSVANFFCQVGLTVVSDERYKTNIQPLVAGLEYVKKLNPVSFCLLEDPNQSIQFGLIAQEVAALGDSRFVSYDDNIDKYSIKYESFIPVLIKAVQDLEIKNKALETVIQNFESRLLELENPVLI